MKLVSVPVSLADANEFIAEHHRHNKPVVGHKYSIGAVNHFFVIEGEPILPLHYLGVCIVGRPIARLQQDGATLEVTRTCVKDSAPKGTNSFLYAKAWQAAKAMGYRRLITYTLKSESGASLRGAGWTVLHEIKAAKGNGWLSRPGRADQAVTREPKFCWGVGE